MTQQLKPKLWIAISIVLFCWAVVQDTKAGELEQLEEVKRAYEFLDQIKRNDPAQWRRLLDQEKQNKPITDPADDLPRLGETTAEYNARMSGKPTIKRQYESSYERTITVGPSKEERARIDRRRQNACDRLSQRAAHNWSARANELYNDYCLD